MPPNPNNIISVAVPLPLRQAFDFLTPENGVTPTIGARVKVPFANRNLVGVIIDIKNNSNVPANRLKRALQVIDDDSLFDDALWRTLHWLSSYYVAPLGEVISAAIPANLRQGAARLPIGKKTWRLTDHGRSSPVDELERAPLQLAIIKRFMHKTLLSSDDFKDNSSGWRQAIKSLIKKNWVEEHGSEPALEKRLIKAPAKVILTTEQQDAVDQLASIVEQDSFACCLLYGITGSGKTEVYFNAIRQVLKQDKQVLLLVPEISLTPQLIDNVKHQFDAPIAVLHSGLNATERHLAWWHCKQGNAKIIIGTRSAVFSSFSQLGLIVVDEEHDGSFKQQDGVRYQARDVAIYRAKQQDIPIILGSATPSLETYSNALAGRYHLFELKERATKVSLPQIQLLDLNRQPSKDGLSPAMLEAISSTLKQKKQVMLFLNRRGYAPVLYCKDCGQSCKCHRCDSHLTLHRRVNRMRCHHCGYEGRTAQKCSACSSDKLVEVGEGTQRVEDAIELRFPSARLLRIDRDSTRRKGELEALLEQARTGQVDILIGTQLITKGHDFPNVGMVGILEADQGLYSTDFRASETLFQQTIQVAGRAGRRDEAGHVFIQTHFPEHAFFKHVKSHDFEGFADTLLRERRDAQYPPYGFFALLRAESAHQARALQFLRRAKRDMAPIDNVRIMDAIAAPMERRAGKFRAQLLLCADKRSSLNTTLTTWLEQISGDKTAKQLANSVRWSLDIDPLDHY